MNTTGICRPAATKALEQLEPAEPAEVDVQDETARRRGIGTIQEVLRGRERLDLKPAGVEQAPERAEKRDIVVDHTHEPRSFVVMGRRENQPALSLFARARAIRFLSGPTLLPLASPAMRCWSIRPG